MKQYLLFAACIFSICGHITIQSNDIRSKIHNTSPFTSDCEFQDPELCARIAALKAEYAQISQLVKQARENEQKNHSMQTEEITYILHDRINPPTPEQIEQYKKSGWVISEEPDGTIIACTPEALQQKEIYIAFCKNVSLQYKNTINQLNSKDV